MSEQQKPRRVLSVDAYRGLVMFLMVAAGMQLYNVAKKFPDSRVWQEIGFHTNHVPWAGASLHDMIQPGFCSRHALPFSIASRQAKGRAFRMLFHPSSARFLMRWRFCVNGRGMTNFRDTSQIGLGYTFLFLLGFIRPAIWHWIVFAIIVIGYWALFAFWPLPSEGLDPFYVGIKPGWDHNFEGFFAHWNINTNPAGAFDRWFLNLFPREKDQLFLGNGGGYATLSFIPTLATMILGLIAGNWMKDATSRPSVWLKLLIAGVVCTAAGLGAEYVGICPIVKPIWTPAWTLYSGGICFLFLLAFSPVFDNGTPMRFLAFPLIVIGANSIFIYCAYYLTGGWLRQTLATHLAIPEKLGHFKTNELL